MWTNAIHKAEENQYANMKFYCQKQYLNNIFNPFQSSVAFHIQVSHLFFSAKQMAGFYIKRNTGLKWVHENAPFPYPQKTLMNTGAKWVNPLSAKP